MVSYFSAICGFIIVYLSSEKKKKMFQYQRNFDIALTSCVMKSFEKYMVFILKTEVNTVLDPLQFAYRQGCSTEDAFNTVTYSMQQRLCFLRRLRLFGVEQKIMFLFYRAVTESIIRYGIRFGLVTLQFR